MLTRSVIVLQYQEVRVRMSLWSDSVDVAVSMDDEVPQIHLVSAEGAAVGLGHRIQVKEKKI